ncbi:hypothetical protein GJ744_010646 [Endocarpon pusillum]|uniref:Heterokaryon incompatibility domain-containing protein n=1 Tax=Endocarpon pusillum TaxID=364733 RepID=A0A8H7E9A4_9EURO|nr:hypothetical protein GJ744_010646 [Endocarpon pusillum]
MELLMANCDISEAPSYLALSYTGGNPYIAHQRTTPKKDTDFDRYLKDTIVLVNGVEFPIRHNLFEALNRFSHTHSKKPFWIDSICINEADPVERIEQIKLMGDIYHQAEEVPIWLGEIRNEIQTQTALDLIKGMLRAFRSWYDANHEAGFRRRWDELIQMTESTPDAIDQKRFWEWLQLECQSFFDGINIKSLGIRTDDRAWDALRRLLSRRWFDRLWTWQEKELARHATVHIGDKSVLWAELRLSMLLIRAHDLSETRLTPFPAMPGREYLHVLDSLNIGRSPDLLDIMINVRHRDTQLAQDKIFGVLGAAAAYCNKPSDVVAYFSRFVSHRYLTTQDLYKEFSRYWIKEKGDLRVLQACNPSTKKMAELPSWVVDWSDTTPSHQLSTRLYNAAKGTQVKVEHAHHINSNGIQLRGVRVDRIKTVCHDKNMETIEGKLANYSLQWDPWKDRLLQRYAGMYAAGVRGKSLSASLNGNWLQAARQIDWNGVYMPTGQPMREAYWRTLLVDHNPYITASADQRIVDEVKIHSVFDRWAWRRGFTRSLLPTTMRPRKPTSISFERWLETLQGSLLFKRFFVTETGLIGLAPSDIQDGDLVCVFLGGRVPFILRQKGDHYTLVKDSYLHGFMDGRAIELAHEGQLEISNFCLM